MKKCFSVLILAVAVLFISGSAQAVQFDFVADTQGWVTENWGNGAPTLSQNAFHGGCLQADMSTMNVPASPGNWAKVFLKRDLTSSENLTSTPIYSLDIFVPDTMWVWARLAVKTGGNWDWHDGGYTTDYLRQETWQTLTWNMTGTPNLNDVRQVGVEITGWYPGPATGTFNLDSVKATGTDQQPVPEPASLLLLGTGLVGLLGFTKKKKA